MGTIISSASNSSVRAVLATGALDEFVEVTGVTTETITGSIRIPLGYVAADNGNVAELTARTTKTGTGGGSTARVYINDARTTLTGATLLGTFDGSATDLFLQLSRTMFIGRDTKIFSPGVTTSPSDNARATAPEVSQAIDWKASDLYIILSIQNASTADTSIGSGLIFKIYK